MSEPQFYANAVRVDEITFLKSRIANYTSELEYLRAENAALIVQSEHLRTLVVYYETSKVKTKRPSDVITYEQMTFDPIWDSEYDNE